MMAQDQAESTREPVNYRKFINQFLPNTIKINAVTQKDKYKNVYTKIPQLFNQIYIYIYISSSSSYRAGSTDIPDPLPPLLPIVHRPR